MSNILEQIVDVKKEEVAALRIDYSLTRFSDSIFWNKVYKNFGNIVATRDNTLSLIAEIKKASPSRGIIRENFNPLQIAECYAEQNVDAMSVLTDKNFFQGDIKYLEEIATRFDTPLLRKDFIIDEYQVFEAKSAGADIILLISEILSASQINELTAAASELNMDVLLELHTSEEFSKIDFRKNKIIGINNRNLKDFSVDVSRCIRIGETLKENYPGLIIVGESGFSKKENVKSALNGAIDCLLVGEHFMKAKNISDELKLFREWCFNED